MDRIVNIGIIGCGGIANGKHMPSLKKIPNVRMIAFCDVIPERAEKAAQDYGVPGAKVYTDYRELLKNPEIEVVHVLTPNREHADMTIDALYAGKHVMCEKPMAKTAADARRMVEAAKATGKKLTIGYQHRQKPQSRYPMVNFFPVAFAASTIRRASAAVFAIGFSHITCFPA